MVRLLLLIACSGCALITDPFATNDFSGDQYPVLVDSRSGGVLVGLRSSTDGNHLAVLDVLSPLTLIDPGRSVPATIDTEDLTLLGDRASAPGTFDLPRGSFEGQQVLRLHPCENTQQFCKLGTPAFEADFDAILGADALAGDSLRMRLGDERVFVLADVGGTDNDRTHACDAVFPSPFRGGGTLIVADTEVPFAGRRVTVQACLSPDPRFDVQPPLPQFARGTDALFVMSSGIGPTLLTESAYARYQLARPGTPPLSMLPEEQVSLPSGAIIGRLTTIDAMALVARASSDPLAPCRQFYAHHLLLDRDCLDIDDCPCEDGTRYCKVPASVLVQPPAGIPVLVVPDDNPTLQALRTEFRPNLQEIDGILGTGAMREVEFDIDYPHNRVIARCSHATCVTRPALGDLRSDRVFIAECMAQAP